MDAESILHLAHPKRAHSMVSTASMLRYGPDVAVPRILDTYRHYGIHQTFFVPAWCAERYPYAAANGVNPRPLVCRRWSVGRVLFHHVL